MNAHKVLNMYILYFENLKKNPTKKKTGAQDCSISRAGYFLVCTHKWFLKTFFNV